MAIDGEIFKVNGGKHVNLMLDPKLPKVRIARRVPVLKDINSIMVDLNHLSPPFI